MKEKVVFCWSGGKDSALALHRLLGDDRYQVVSLLTTCNERFRRVSMHGVRIELLEAQAAALGLPIDEVFVRDHGSNEEYERAMAACLAAHQRRGVTACAFGDIFLQDLRQWREANLARVGLRAVFPLWQSDTRKLVGDFLGLGFSALVCCANAAYLGRDAVGCPLTQAYVACPAPGCRPVRRERRVPLVRPRRSHLPPPGTVQDRRDRLPGDRARPERARASGPRSTRGFWYCDLAPAP